MIIHLFISLNWNILFFDINLNKFFFKSFLFLIIFIKKYNICGKMENNNQISNNSIENKSNLNDNPNKSDDQSNNEISNNSTENKSNLNDNSNKSNDQSNEDNKSLKNHKDKAIKNLVQFEKKISISNIGYDNKSYINDNDDNKNSYDFIPKETRK